MDGDGSELVDTSGRPATEGRWPGPPAPTVQTAAGRFRRPVARGFNRVPQGRIFARLKSVNLFSGKIEPSRWTTLRYSQPSVIVAEVGGDATGKFRRGVLSGCPRGAGEYGRVAPVRRRAGGAGLPACTRGPTGRAQPRQSPARMRSTGGDRHGPGGRRGPSPEWPRAPHSRTTGGADERFAGPRSSRHRQGRWKSVAARVASHCRV